MEGIQEVKDLFAGTQTTLEALRGEFEALKGKQADVVDTARLDAMKADLAEKMTAEQEAATALKERLDTLEAQANRPGGMKGQPEDVEKKVFLEYIRTGKDDAPELKAMATNQASDGGFAVPVTMAPGIQERYRRSSPMRQISNVVSGFVGSSYDILVERGDAGHTWVGAESDTATETTSPTIDRISISLNQEEVLPKVSQRMLDNASFDVEGWLMGYIVRRTVRAEETAFVAGDGLNKPKGVVSYATATTADESRASATLQHRVTGASGAFNGSDPADVLIKTFYDLQPEYQGGATWLMSQATAGEVAVLQDGQGKYLLERILNAETGALVSSIMGRPMMMAQDMPAIAANSLSIAVGDFGAGYTVIDGQTHMLRDPYSSKPHVLFYTTKFVGGGVSDFDAIKLIKFST